MDSKWSREFLLAFKAFKVSECQNVSGTCIGLVLLSEDLWPWDHKLHGADAK